MALKPQKLSERHADFFEAVYQVVRLIPKGRVTSYGAIANYLGAKRGARMVGWAMNAAHQQENPVPAHRVVNRLGILSGKHHFPEHSPMQASLEAEGLEVVEDQIQSFKAHYWDPSEALNLN